MAATFEREEWKAFSDFMALAASGFLALVGVILALVGKDPAMKFHGCLLLGAAGLSFLYLLTQLVERAEPEAAIVVGRARGLARERPGLVRLGRQLDACDPDTRRVDDDAGDARGAGRRRRAHVSYRRRARAPVSDRSPPWRTRGSGGTGRRAGFRFL